MKKLLYLLLTIILITFISCNKEEEEDCGCVKTTHRSGRALNSSNNGQYYSVVTATENVLCQNSESYVDLGGDETPGGGGRIWYTICCENINDPDSQCDRLYSESNS